ncbi:MAG: hypothetical protein HY776_05060 [Actinobacteria bacterium]|nr:hypothetical protein [Actinomycetota bacterium]
MILKNYGDISVNCTPPHDVVGEPYKKNLPSGRDAKVLIDLINASQLILDSYESPANSIWLWGEGKALSMPSFLSRFNLKGSIISAVDLINGIGRCIGLAVIKVPGATGNFDTNYKGKAVYALNSLKENDFVFIHIEAPDEAGHIGDINAKIESIEKIDELVVGTVLDGLKSYPDYKIMVVPDHPTPIKIKTHSADPVPFLIYSSNPPIPPLPKGDTEGLAPLAKGGHRGNSPLIKGEAVKLFPPLEKGGEGGFESSSFDEFVDEYYIDKGHELMDFFLT